MTYRSPFLSAFLILPLLAGAQPAMPIKPAKVAASPKAAASVSGKPMVKPQAVPAVIVSPPITNYVKLQWYQTNSDLTAFNHPDYIRIFKSCDGKNWQDIGTADTTNGSHTFTQSSTNVAAFYRMDCIRWSVQFTNVEVESQP